MKHLFLTLTTILFFQTSHAQLMGATSGGDTLITADGVRFIVGEDIKLGNGTMDNGDFKYVTPSRKGWATLSGNTAYKNVPAKFSGHLCRVKAIRDYGSKKHGYITYLILGGGQAINFECDIENALKAGEVVVAGYTSPSSRQVVVQQSEAPSMADELRKLKKLRDDGILTDAEYHAQKKKLLDK